jgi:hypothetical protein
LQSANQNEFFPQENGQKGEGKANPFHGIEKPPRAAFCLFLALDRQREREAKVESMKQLKLNAARSGEVNDEELIYEKRRSRHEIINSLATLWID